MWAHVFLLQGQVLISPNQHFNRVPCILQRNLLCQCHSLFLTVALWYPKRRPPFKDIKIPTLLVRSGNKYIPKPNYFSLQISVVLFFFFESYLSLGRFNWLKLLTCDEASPCTILTESHLPLPPSVILKNYSTMPRKFSVWMLSFFSLFIFHTTYSNCSLLSLHSSILICLLH